MSPKPIVKTGGLGRVLLVDRQAFNPPTNTHPDILYVMELRVLGSLAALNTYLG